MPRIVALALIAIAASASAAPITGMVGVGASRLDDSIGDTSITLSLDGLVAIRATPALAIGLRASVSAPVDYSYCICGGGGDASTVDYKTVPIDLGVTAIYDVRPLWIAPWVGQQVDVGSETWSGMVMGSSIDEHDRYFHADFLMLGLSAGVDIVERGANKLSVYADYRHSVWSERSGEDDPRFTSWSAVTIGLAYRR